MVWVFPRVTKLRMWASTDRDFSNPFASEENQIANVGVYRLRFIKSLRQRREPNCKCGRLPIATFQIPSPVKRTKLQMWASTDRNFSNSFASEENQIVNVGVYRSRFFKSLRHDRKPYSSMSMDRTVMNPTTASYNCH